MYGVEHMILYEKLEVSELVVLARTRDDMAFAELVRRYTPMMSKLVSSSFESSYDRDEAFSEACASLHRAVMTYNLERSEVTFGLYSRICIRNRLLDLLKREDGDMISDVDIESLSSGDNIESRLIMRESVERYKRIAKQELSDYEYRVFLLVLRGEKTRDIAGILGTTPKSVDNAKARMKRALKKSMPDEENI